MASKSTLCQQSFSITYNCYRVFVPSGVQGRAGTPASGTWTPPVRLTTTVYFSVGPNKNVVVAVDGVKKTYVRVDKPFVAETKDGMKYQFIATTLKGKKYFFQYLEDQTLRLHFTDRKEMMEYSCIE
ncbi:MAG: hypothetical protein EAY75_10180 [Bacteroidetes bacterium]|nr:MAG: hypothetical protein EAY75_10180 [Bacteroidota bacterium]